MSGRICGYPLNAFGEGYCFNLHHFVAQWLCANVVLKVDSGSEGPLSNTASGAWEEGKKGQTLRKRPEGCCVLKERDCFLQGHLKSCDMRGSWRVSEKLIWDKPKKWLKTGSWWWPSWGGIRRCPTSQTLWCWVVSWNPLNQKDRIEETIRIWGCQESRLIKDWKWAPILYWLLSGPLLLYPFYGQPLAYVSNRLA